MFEVDARLMKDRIGRALLTRRGIRGVGQLGEVPAAKSLSHDSISVSTSHPNFWAPFILVG
jgi:hypothetical protein